MSFYRFPLGYKPLRSGSLPVYRRLATTQSIGLTAALATDAPTLSASVNVEVPGSITAALTTEAPTLASTIAVTSSLTAALTTDAPTIASTVAVSSSITAALTTDAPTLAATITDGSDADYTAYSSRVTTDGGTIADATHIQNIITTLKAQSAWSDLVAAYSASGGYRTVSGNVDVWYNIKGSTGDATQTSAGSRPAYQATGGANSKPALSFNGHQLSTSLTTPSSINHTVIAVWQHGAGNTGYRGIWATSGMMMLASDNGAWGTYGSTDRPASTTLSSGSNYILEMARATGTGQFYRNGTADGTYADTTGQSPSHIGGTLGQESVGKLMALFAFQIELNSTQLTAIRSLLNSYYSIY